MDWREYEEDVIHYFNDQLPESDPIKYKIIEIDKPRGIAIVLRSDSRELTIPFAEDRTDRDKAIRSMAIKFPV